MPDMPARLPAARRRELASVAIDDLCNILGRYQVPAQPLVCHLAHVYWNFRYGTVSRPAIERIEAAKAEGVEWADFKEELRQRFKREDDAALEQQLCARDGTLDALTLQLLRETYCRRQIELAAILDTIPDRLLDAEGNIVWLAERPRHTFEPMRKYSEAEPAPAPAEPEVSE